MEMQMHDQGDQEEANEGEGEMRTGADYKAMARCMTKVNRRKRTRARAKTEMRIDADYKAMAMCKIIQTDEEGR